MAKAAEEKAKAVTTVNSKKGEKFRRFLLDSKKTWQLYLFCVIPLAYLLIFNYYPMFGVQIAFKSYTASKGIWGSQWVGLKHFKTFFTSYQFSRTIINTLRISVYSLLTGFPLAIVFALMLNLVRNARIKKWIQTITYVPHFISTIVIVGIIFQLFNPVTGVYGYIYRIFNPGEYPVDLFTKADVFPHMYIWSGIWQQLGWSSIIYIAALAGVDPELHEAAEIDGANRWQRIWTIDLPAILPTASIMLILRFGSIMSVGYEKVYLMQNDLNLVKSEVISTYIYKVGLKSATTFSYGTAIGLFNSVINCTLLVLVNWIAGRFGEGGTSLW
ncbi:MAG: sugar ABC transporter permease [Clostridiales bacterium]|nr:sugar ABC transporter permease [Clostridiales bacterium]